MKSLVPYPFRVSCHHDNVSSGGTFIVVKGMRVDGQHFIAQALKNGACTIVIQYDHEITEENHTIIEHYRAELKRVPNIQQAMAEMSAHAYDYPAKKLKLFGITGTKGKTTTAYLLRHIFHYAGFKTALISSAFNAIDGQQEKSKLTTPHPDYLHAFLHECVKQEVEIVIMEVAAQAVSLSRVHNLAFDGLIYTNFNQEHGEFYATQEDYFAAKADLIKQLKPDGFIVINRDYKIFDALIKHPRAKTYSLFDRKAHFFGQYTLIKPWSSRIDLCFQNTQIPFCLSLPGTYNIENAMAAASMTLLHTIKPHQICSAFECFFGVPGRCEIIRDDLGPDWIIDKAHNPSSFQALLSTLRSSTSHLITVFGAGGERDTIKRPLMGTIASQWSDMVILTSDDPRNENPFSIINDIKVGIKNTIPVFEEIDREKALYLAAEKALSNSTIAVLGKGSEEYQTIGNDIQHFSERQIIKTIIKKNKNILKSKIEITLQN